jgi:hypothetical protein
MKYIIIFSLLFLNCLNADQNSISSLSQSFKKSNLKYKKDLTRHQMLREAKYLNKKYEDAVLKLENWDLRKEELKKDFLRKNPHLETSFGTGNEYGKKRAQKRKREYYKSLDKQEGYLQTRVAEAEAKLQDLKEEFLFQFAVPLTDEEINGGKIPEVTDRDQKVEMLNNYINETDAWKKCKERVADFESVQSIAISIEKLFPDTKLTQLYIETKSSQNLDEIRSHSEMLKKLEQDYREKYGLSITSASRAKAIIQKIHSN